MLMVRDRRSWSSGDARQAFMGAGGAMDVFMWCWWCEAGVHGMVVVRDRRAWGAVGARQDRIKTEAL